MTQNSEAAVYDEWLDEIDRSTAYKEENPNHSNLTAFVPFGYYVGKDEFTDIDFTELRNDPNVLIAEKDQVWLPDDARKWIQDHWKTRAILSPDEFQQRYYRILDKPQYQHIKKRIVQSFNWMMERVLNKPMDDELHFKMTSSWTTRIWQSQHIQLHNHFGSYYSGVCYLGTDYDRSSNLILENPLMKDERYHFESPHWHHPSVSNLVLDASEGKTYYFPSSVNHFSKVHESPNVRQSMSFNFEPAGSMVLEGKLL